MVLVQDGFAKDCRAVFVPSHLMDTFTGMRLGFLLLIVLLPLPGWSQEALHTNLTPNKLYIWIHSNPDQGSDESHLTFKVGGNTEYLRNEDVLHLNGYINLSTLSSDAVSLAFNVFPEFNRDYTIPVRMLLPANCTYTVRFDSLDSFDPSARFFFEDKRSPFARRDTIQDLRDTNAYSFNFAGSNLAFVTRFYLICQAPVAAKPALPGTTSDLEAYLFPNPASSIVAVKLSGTKGKAAYRVLSSNGAPVLEGHAESKDFTLDVRGLARGLYLFRVEDAVSSVTRRFAVE